jgi:arginine deiminase
MLEKTGVKVPYGCEDFGRLTHVMMHRPGRELEIIDEGNCGDWLFDRVPDIERFADEHDRYRHMLVAHGVEVLELSDYVNDHHEWMPRMPNLTYMHDTAVITSKGAILSSMAWAGRKSEDVVVREALNRLGIPILIDFDSPQDSFEGCLLLSGETVLVAETERHNRRSIEKFIRKALTAFREVIYVNVPKARRYMHPDTIYNRVTPRLALAYLPAFRACYLYTREGVGKIDFAGHMRRRGVEIIGVSDSEQGRLACSFVALEPGVILHYDTALDRDTWLALARNGVEAIFFHPDAMTAGGGSLRCITLRLRRAPQSALS